MLLVIVPLQLPASTPSLGLLGEQHSSISVLYSTLFCRTKKANSYYDPNAKFAVEEGSVWICAGNRNVSCVRAQSLCSAVSESVSGSNFGFQCSNPDGGLCRPWDLFRPLNRIYSHNTTAKFSSRLKVHVKVNYIWVISKTTDINKSHLQQWNLACHAMSLNIIMTRGRHVIK